MLDVQGLHYSWKVGAFPVAVVELLRITGHMECGTNAVMSLEGRRGSLLVAMHEPHVLIIFGKDNRSRINLLHMVFPH